jgi:hypothetical protein
MSNVGTLHKFRSPMTWSIDRIFWSRISVTGMDGEDRLIQVGITNIIDSPKHNKDRFTLDYVLGHDFISS